ncbi:MAG: branched-chain amino acid ABC transporter permease [Desulfobacterales bacterium]
MRRAILWFLLFIGAAALIPVFIKDAFFLRIVTELFMWIGLAITWDVMAGYAGYLNFGHGAFFGAGAYVTAILMMRSGWPFFATLPVAGLFAATSAFLAGMPTLRLRGAYFAIATWALALAVQQVALVLDITGGPDGMRLPPFLDPIFFFYLMLSVAVATFFLLWLLLERAPFGLKLKAIREDESGAMALGLNPARIKMQAFILSATPAGILGGIYAYWITFIDPASVLADIITDQAMVMAVFGGLGTLFGPVIGAVIVFSFKTIFWAYLSEYQVLYLIILGAVIALTVVFLPNGILGTITGRLHGRNPLRKGLSVGAQPDRPPTQGSSND